tara:strand:+ start:689 stop:1300 length:612 start_codon:yes stop_codon:yes gene_type:complete
MTLRSDLFNEDYYENGIARGISGYENYRWIPSRSIPEALEIKNSFEFNTCVDYGCAKGFLVSALRILGVEAYGEDISEYAVNNCMPSVSDYITYPNDKKCDLLISKDVLEHIPEVGIQTLLESLGKKSEQFFFVIPLGDNNKFRIKEYEVDVTHVIKKDEEWWIKIFRSCGYELVDFSYSFGAIKEKWLDYHPYGNGFFVLKR